MKILSMELQNYGPFYGLHTFDFRAHPGLVLLLGRNLDDPRSESNGGGKSSLLGALDWGLWGENPNGDHADAQVNEEALQERGYRSRVVIHLEDEQGRLVDVDRWREKSRRGLHLLVGGKELTTLDPRETQREVERMLGLDREVFHASVLFAQKDDAHYATATDAERLKLLTRILQLEDLDAWLAAAKERLKAQALAEAEIARQQMTEQARLDVLRTATYQEDADRWEADRGARVEVLGRRLVALPEEERAAQEAAALRLAQMVGEDLQPKIDAWEADRGGRLGSLQVELTQGLADLETAEAEAVQASQQLAARQQALDQEQQALARPAAPEGLENGRRTVAQVEIQLETAESEMRKFAQQVGRMRTLGVGACSQCGQPVTAEHLQAEIARLEAGGREIGARADAMQVRLEEWQAYVAGLERVAALAAQAFDAAVQGLEKRQALLRAEGSQLLGASSARARRRQELDRLALRLRAVEQEVNPAAAQALEQQALLARERQAIEQQLAATVANVGFRRTQLETDLQAAQAEVNPWTAKLAGQAQALAAQQQTLDALAARATGLVETRQYLEFWETALGPRGLRSYVLDSRLQELTDAANQWVQLLTGGVCWVRFTAQKELRSKKGELVNSPDLQIYRWNPDGTITNRNFASWSGGEAQRISFAVDFGLSRLIARRAQKSYDLLILDEAFKHLDRRGKEATVEMLRQLAAEKSTVLVVEHDADFQDEFDSRILVEKQGRRSRIVELQQEVASAGEPEKDPVGEARADVPDDPPRARPRRRRARG